MKLLIFNDPHIRAINPINRTDSFYETIKAKLKDIVTIAAQEKVSAILCTGDLFDNPSPSPRIVSEILDILLSAKLPLYTIAGNHDIFGHNPDTLDRTILGLLGHYKVVNIIKPSSIEVGRLDAASVLCQKTSIKLSPEITLTGTSFYHDIENNPEAFQIRKETKYHIHLVHAMMVVKPFRFSNYILTKDIKSDADVIAAGHQHFGFEAHKIGNTYFINPGAVARLSAIPDNLYRNPQIAILEFVEGIEEKEIKIKYLELPSAPLGKDIFNFKKIEEQKTHSEQIEKFIASLNIPTLQSLNIRELIEKITKEENIPEEIKTEVFNRLGKTVQLLHR